MTTTHVMKISPPQFAPGPVDGAALTQAFATFYQYVLARMDLRYPGNDFGGLGNTGHVLTSTGVDAPVFMPTGFPTVDNNTVVGNVSGAPAQAIGLTKAQLTTLVNLVTDALSGAVPALPNDAAKFFNGVGTYVVPTYPVGANPTAKVGSSAVNGTATTFMRSDAAPPLDVTVSYTFTGNISIAPASGNALTLTPASATLALVVGGISAGTPVIECDNQATTGAKTATFTATNKPGTTNQTTPVVWLPIDCDGTTYYFPGFAA